MEERSSLGRFMAASLLAHLFLAMLTPSLAPPGGAILKAPPAKVDLVSVDLMDVEAERPVPPTASEAPPARPKPETAKLTLPAPDPPPDRPKEIRHTTAKPEVAAEIPTNQPAPTRDDRPVETASIPPAPVTASESVRASASSGVSAENLISSVSTASPAASWSVPVAAVTSGSSQGTPPLSPRVQAPPPGQVQGLAQTPSQELHQARPQLEPVAQASREPAPASQSAVSSAQAARPVVHRESPLYPAEARRKGWEGRVRLEVLVNASGKVTKARVVDSSGYPALDQAAQKAAAKWRFTPAPNQPPAPSGPVPPESEPRIINIVFELK